MTTQPFARDPRLGDAAGANDETEPVSADKPTPFARVAARLAEVSPGHHSAQDDPGEEDADHADLSGDTAGRTDGLPDEPDSEADYPVGDGLPEDEVEPLQPVSPDAAVPSASDPGDEEPGDEEPHQPAPPMVVTPQTSPVQPGIVQPGMAQPGMPGFGAAEDGMAEPAEDVSSLPPLPLRSSGTSVPEWSEIKALFVDDPPTSVRMAAKQVEFEIERLTSAMKRAQDQAAASSGQGLAQLTEHLRTTLLAYQEVCTEISRLTGRLPGPKSENTSLSTTP